MNRRETLGLIATTAITGCVGENNSTTTETTVTDQNQFRVSVANCLKPLPQIRGESYCYEDLDQDWLGAGANIRGETEVTLRVINQSESNVRVGPSAWTIWHNQKDEWVKYIEPAQYDIAFDLEPGDSYAWMFSPRPVTGEPEPPRTDVGQEWSDNENQLLDVPLGPGEYYFGVKSVNRVEKDDKLNVLFPLTVSVSEQ